MQFLFIKKQLKSIIFYFAIVSLFIAIILGVIFSGRAVIKAHIYPQKFKAQVEESSIKYNIDKNLIYAVIKVESNFNKKAKSSKGAMGLMQITYKTAEYIARLKGENTEQIDLFNENINIDYGAFYLRYLLDKFNCLENAICAYNAGEGKVKGWLKNKEFSDNGITLKIVPYLETSEYLKKIQLTFSKYKKYY
jgi:soluble lytic murein transglycosylase